MCQCVNYTVAILSQSSCCDIAVDGEPSKANTVLCNIMYVLSMAGQWSVLSEPDVLYNVILRSV